MTLTFKVSSEGHIVTFALNLGTLWLFILVDFLTHFEHLAHQGVGDGQLDGAERHADGELLSALPGEGLDDGIAYQQLLHDLPQLSVLDVNSIDAILA